MNQITIKQKILDEAKASEEQAKRLRTYANELCHTCGNRYKIDELFCSKECKNKLYSNMNHNIFDRDFNEELCIVCNGSKTTEHEYCSDGCKFIRDNVRFFFPE